MTPFTEWIEINKHPTEFHFRQIVSPQQDKFFISTVGPHETTNICFDMTMTSQGEWNIVKPVPDYIDLLKEQLIKRINEHSDMIPTEVIPSTTQLKTVKLQFRDADKLWSFVRLLTVRKFKVDVGNRRVICTCEEAVIEEALLLDSAKLIRDNVNYKPC